MRVGNGDFQVGGIDCRTRKERHLSIGLDFAFASGHSRTIGAFQGKQRIGLDIFGSIALLSCDRFELFLNQATERGRGDFRDVALAVAEFQMHLPALGEGMSHGRRLVVVGRHDIDGLDRSRIVERERLLDEHFGEGVVDFAFDVLLIDVARFLPLRLLLLRRVQYGARADFSLDLLLIDVALPRVRHPQAKVMAFRRVTKWRQLFDGDVLVECFLQFFPHRFGLLPFGELHHDRDAAGKVDVVVGDASCEKCPEPYHDQHGRRDRRDDLFADEIKIRHPDQAQHAHFFDRLRLFQNVHDEPADVHGRVQVHRQADNQRHGETLDLFGADHVQDHRADQRGNVRIENGGEGLVEPVVDRHPQAGSARQFLPHSLVDQHVGVDGHAGAQHQPGQARERERGFDEGHHKHDE